MIILQDNITSIIPQRPPFVMIDQLVSCDEICSNTIFKITADNVLVDNGELSEAGIIENIAQTAAAGLGYITLQGNKPIVIGYIAAIKNLEIFAQPKVGDTIQTNVTTVNQIFDVTIISGSVKCHEILIAKCEMKIFTKK
ncbi:MAG: 3-hydroxyacyl-ACP dehydratase [Mucilaginibacter sp.]|nr:3-hydroxyacyl-ACP dehydratase [Mucilaginibacter sp.]